MDTLIQQHDRCPLMYLPDRAMTNPANDIFKQAQQGSVAAIIQILNDKFADTGVRTRAIFAEGVLQLLCEAATLDQLEQPILVERVRYQLEAIAPRNIRRVNINSRIVREQQLLWLEEISRDPHNQVLWSEEIILKRPHLFKRLMTDWKVHNETAAHASQFQPSVRQSREQRQFSRGLVGGAAISVLTLAGGWAIYHWFGGTQMNSTQAIAPVSLPNTVSQTAHATASQPAPIALSQPSAQPKPEVPNDPFVNAVRLAERASQEGQAAKSSAQWLDLAARWQKASDLMASVPNSDQRYKTAQSRVSAYRQNSESALQSAQRLSAQSPTSETAASQPSDTPEKTR